MGEGPIIVLGPRTRLVQALSALAVERSRSLVLVARDAAEADDLRSRLPAATVVEGGAGSFPALSHGVAIVCCAFGPIHPEGPRPADALRSFERDRAWLGLLLDSYSEIPVHVVFVSSVVALAPPRRRSDYGGWKNLAEGAIGTLVRRHANARYSVVFPGRLAVERSARAAFSTPYLRLARRILDGTGRGPARRLIGLDARLWLLARSLRIVVAAGYGRVERAP